MEYYHQDYFGQTLLHPLALFALVVLGAATLLVPRRLAVLPFMVMACFISPAQRVVVGGLNFDLLRVMLVVGTLRVLLRGEFRDYRRQPLDVVLLAWGLYQFMTLNLLYRDAATFKNSLGTTFDIFGFYFIFRILIRNWSDAGYLIAGVIAISVPVALAFTFERATGRNVFSIFGRVPEMTVSRAGRLRCQGAYAHPILAGCFWATLLPLIVVQWWRGGRWRTGAAVGGACAMIIILNCASSTPMVAVALAGAGACLYPFRGRMRAIRWATVAVLLGLHLSMNVPVWHLLSRIDFTGGSTGWQRYFLIDQAIAHLQEWWLIGSTKGTMHWGWILFDVTNEYVLQGLHGGLGLVALFVTLFAVGFQSIGRWLRQAAGDPAQRRLAWATGLSLATHAANFMAVTYFGQSVMLWYLTLALVGSLSAYRGGIAAGGVRRFVVVRRRVPAGPRPAEPVGAPRRGLYGLDLNRGVS